MARKTTLIFMLLMFLLVMVGPALMQDAVTIEFWIPSGRGRDEGSAAVVEAFEAANPGIQVEITSIPFGEFLNALQVAYAGNTPPDVVLTNGVAIQNLAYNGALLPIDDALTEEDIADFMPDLVDMVTYDGQMYGIPWAQAGAIIYYNADLFEAAGVVPPATLEDTWTWPEFVENVNAVRAYHQDQGTDLWGMVGIDNPMTGSFFTWTLIRSNSSPGEPLWESIAPDFTTVAGYIDTPEAMEAYAFYQSLYTDDFMPSDEVPDAFGTGPGADNYFAILRRARN
ncbi:MAG: extracellular solute-binding protein [Chloroflexi bacterium]|nr:extracellular solute-binding protein [Chloroflexota bacterium]